MNRIGIGVYNFQLNSSVGSMPRRIGGRPESSRSTLSPDPLGP